MSTLTKVSSTGASFIRFKCSACSANKHTQQKRHSQRKHKRQKHVVQSNDAPRSIWSVTESRRTCPRRLRCRVSSDSNTDADCEESVDFREKKRRCNAANARLFALKAKYCRVAMTVIRYCLLTPTLYFGQKDTL